MTQPVLSSITLSDVPERPLVTYSVSDQPITPSDVPLVTYSVSDQPMVSDQSMVSVQPMVSDQLMVTPDIDIVTPSSNSHNEVSHPSGIYSVPPLIGVVPGSPTSGIMSSPLECQSVPPHLGSPLPLPPVFPS